MTLPALRTSIGELPLHEYRLALAGRAWSFLHTGAVVTFLDEQSFLRREQGRVP